MQVCVRNFFCFQRKSASDEENDGGKGKKRGNCAGPLMHLLFDALLNSSQDLRSCLRVYRASSKSFRVSVSFSILLLGLFGSLKFP